MRAGVHTISFVFQPYFSFILYYIYFQQFVYFLNLEDPPPNYISLSFMKKNSYIPLLILVNLKLTRRCN
jgi:hypothetical protein